VVAFEPVNIGEMRNLKIRKLILGPEFEFQMMRGYHGNITSATGNTRSALAAEAMAEIRSSWTDNDLHLDAHRIFW